MVEFSEDRLIPLPLVLAERVATVLPILLLSIAKVADSVEVPPIRRSTVVFLGFNAPFS